MKSIIFSMLIIFGLNSMASEIEIDPSEVIDFDEKTGIGCIQSKPDAEKIVHVVCKSKKSAELAWNALMYRAKNTCGSQKVGILFRIPPELPAENGVFAAQMEFKCKIAE